ncbi:MAG TPA: AsmA-like C-terminal region-containing protein [Terriglobales bacterium]|nr:AsmA-like C-terminal region-containing protein [Terriglobales bacterium]
MPAFSPPARLDHRKKKFLAAAILIVTVVFVATTLLVRHFWPFAESSIKSRLARSTSAHVHFGRFHEKYFPPGCVAENVVFERNGHNVIAIQRLTIRSGLLGLFRHHVSVLRAEGARIVLTKSDVAAARSSDDQTTLDQLIADGAVLEVTHGQQRPPLRFIFHRFRLQNLGGSGTTKFSAVFENPLPQGLVRTSGQFGPWNSSGAAATQVSGEYSLENADLGVFHGIGGRITSKGSFKGTFRQMEVEGSTAAPQFEVTSTQHSLPLYTQFSAFVNATNGETVLRDIKAKFGHDEIDARGSVAGGPDGKRAATIDLACARGRIEDTFYPFISSPRSPVTGDVEFHLQVVIAPGNQRFVQKIKLASDFRILNAAFTNARTESRMNQMAEAPHQKEPLEARDTQMQGQVRLSNGVAHLSNFYVRDGGASAQLQGSYNLVDERVNMHGKLTTEASLSKTTSGIKAAFAKALEPIFKKHGHEKVVPVKISGTYKRPSFGLDFSSNSSKM